MLTISVVRQVIRSTLPLSQPEAEDAKRPSQYEVQWQVYSSIAAPKSQSCLAKSTLIWEVLLFWEDQAKLQLIYSQYSLLCGETAFLGLCFA